MYQYDLIDKEFLADRSAEFRGQVARRLSGELTEDQFKPLRLMNGLYLQLHAYMLRVAIPYGSLNSTQARRLAQIARDFDKGYGHFTTRQNIQFNWIKLKDAPEILDKLAEVDLHAIQTSGNCIRNTTSDPYAGATAEEVDDPRVWSEVIRQWSTLHPEFSFLPRKFKIAITASAKDRTAAKVHDIGLMLRKGRDGTLGFEVIVGGGQGRTPYVGPTINEFLPTDRLLSYLEAVLRVYNRHGRRDNIYKARIKILVAALGAEEFARQVDEEWAKIDAARADLPTAELARIRAAFAKTPFETLPARSDAFETAKANDAAFARFVRNNVKPHKQPGYAIVEVSLKAQEQTPGDASAQQLEVVADLAERFSLNDLRVTHAQNLVLPHVKLDDLPTVFATLQASNLATPNIDLVSDIIACPGLDYCALANARAIPVAQDIARQFADLDRAEKVGELKIKISGCINACGHHHVAHIGILGVDKKGEEFYQLSLGGSGAEDASIGKILGPALPADKVATAVDQLVGAYLNVRNDGERFLDTYRRVGLEPFKEAVYAQAD
ncbi:nitrite/sulfite reductase [Caulobacter vibrioides]|uniref:Sulfite reductase (NADPH) hemoprotein beta-component n=2 Tax=Caulobacter vibrioides TaxID=155892 RepID=Q9A975_CAUVC|nr:nitrite/sulfite reductase [Caulobacter vibrioides]YP_002516550.1 sulfite reductase, beta subunit [Caulobacter vibrioides NA1000]AAK23103.1 sulfite reductase (NADPH) hemoprotein beta-component [Caulobacter vibrioides CB15]ACL94642.1 sulfite reductase, beta subunit [Caulobacter vibrioides NA1000]ATC27948.1 nitrite/sulfite reductase [Caulobacter vibrioides]QXZ53202.1 nitrite/sulfite reductase [Caulobacter vibrioides]